MIFQLPLPRMGTGRVWKSLGSPTTILLACLSAGLSFRILAWAFNLDAHVTTLPGKAKTFLSVNGIGSWATHSLPRTSRSRVLVASSFGAHDDGASSQEQFGDAD
jgi:hypothetical protein